MYNLLVGGAAGQGVDTTVAILESFIKQTNNHIFTMRDLMSRVRGGHNFCRVRFGPHAVKSHSEQLDGIVALHQEAIDRHLKDLKPGGFLLCESTLQTSDPRAIKLNFTQIAKALGNTRASGSVAVGAVLKLFGIPVTKQNAQETFMKMLKPSLIPANVQCLLAGHDAVEGKFKLSEGRAGKQMLISGNRAIALGALAAGLQFYAAYPMSPSTGILEFLGQHAKEAGIVVEQAEDEIAAINMAIGASFAGARAMTGTSGGGFSLKVEALGLSGMAEIPLVTVNVQRPGPVTGLPTRTEQSDLRFVISASQGEFPRMVIALRDHADAFYQTMRAFNLADKYQIPVVLLSDQYLADSTATIPMLDPQRVPRYEEPPHRPQGDYARYRYTRNGISPRLIPGSPLGLVSADSDEHDEHGHIIEDSQTRILMMDKRMGKMKLLLEELEEPAVLGEEEPELLLLGWGTLFGALEEAVALINSGGVRRCGALVFGDVWPLPQERLRKAAAKAGTIINVEQNYTGQLGMLIREQTGIAMNASILKYDGRQLGGEEIVERLNKEVIA